MRRIKKLFGYLRISADIQRLYQACLLALNFPFARLQRIPRHKSSVKRTSRGVCSRKSPPHTPRLYALGKPPPVSIVRDAYEHPPAGGIGESAYVACGGSFSPLMVQRPPKSGPSRRSNPAFCNVLMIFCVDLLILFYATIQRPNFLPPSRLMRLESLN